MRWIRRKEAGTPEIVTPVPARKEAVRIQMSLAVTVEGQSQVGVVVAVELTLVTEAAR